MDSLQDKEANWSGMSRAKSLNNGMIMGQRG